MELKMTVTVGEMKQGKVWDRYCQDNGINGYGISVSEEQEISLSDEQAKKYGFLGETYK